MVQQLLGGCREGHSTREQSFYTLFSTVPERIYPNDIFPPSAGHSVAYSIVGSVVNQSFCNARRYRLKYSGILRATYPSHRNDYDACTVLYYR